MTLCHEQRLIHFPSDVGGWKRVSLSKSEGVPPTANETSVCRLSYSLRLDQVAPFDFRFGEVSAMTWSLILIVLWLFRDPFIFPGWGVFFHDGYVHVYSHILELRWPMQGELRPITKAHHGRGANSKYWQFFLPKKCPVLPFGSGAANIPNFS